MFYSLECGWACFLSYTSNQRNQREREHLKELMGGNAEAGQEVTAR